VPGASLSGRQGTCECFGGNADKSFCVSGQPSDGNCVAFQLPKVRMVRVPRAASIGQQGNLAKSGAAAPTPGVEKGIAEPEKAQKSAHRQDQRSTHPLSVH
jgi:hypothetical protein